MLCYCQQNPLRELSILVGYIIHLNKEHVWLVCGRFKVWGIAMGCQVAVFSQKTSPSIKTYFPVYKILTIYLTSCFNRPLTIMRSKACQTALHNLICSVSNSKSRNLWRNQSANEACESKFRIDKVDNSKCSISSTN